MWKRGFSELSHEDQKKRVEEARQKARDWIMAYLKSHHLRETDHMFFADRFQWAVKVEFEDGSVEKWIHVHQVEDRFEIHWDNAQDQEAFDNALAQGRSTWMNKIVSLYEKLVAIIYGGRAGR